MTRSEFYEQKSKQRAAFYEQKQRERAAARADARRGQFRSRAIRTVSRGGGSIARTIVGSFDKVLEIALAIVLLFAMFSNAGAYAKMVGAVDNGMIMGVMTPVTALLATEANTPAPDVVGKPSRNFADARATMGVGWYESGGEVRPLFFNLSDFAAELQSWDLDGEGDVFTRGMTELVKITAKLFKGAFDSDAFGTFETFEGVTEFVFNNDWLTSLAGPAGNILKALANVFYGIFGGGS